MCMNCLWRGKKENGESWGGGGRYLVLVVQWTPDRDCFLSTGPASSLWLLPGQWLGNYEECLETISFFWAHGWSRRGWMAFLCLFLFYIQQIRQAGCCGDDTGEVSCTPAPQTRSLANKDLRNPEDIFFFNFPFFFFFPIESAQEERKKRMRWQKRGGRDEGKSQSIFNQSIFSQLIYLCSRAYLLQNRMSVNKMHGLSIGTSWASYP